MLKLDPTLLRTYLFVQSPELFDPVILEQLPFRSAWGLQGFTHPASSSSDSPLIPFTPPMSINPREIKPLLTLSSLPCPLEFQRYFGDIKKERFFFKQGTKSYFLNHLGDSARRRFKRKLLPHNHVKNKSKNVHVPIKSYSGLKKSPNGQYYCQKYISLMRKTLFFIFAVTG